MPEKEMVVTFQAKRSITQVSLVEYKEICCEAMRKEIMEDRVAFRPEGRRDLGEEVRPILAIQASYAEVTLNLTFCPFCGAEIKMEEA